MQRVYSAHQLLLDEIVQALRSACPELPAEAAKLVERAPPDHGDLTVNSLKLAKEPDRAYELAEEVARKLTTKPSLVGRVNVEGNFINIFINPSTYGELLWSAVSSLGSEYGHNPAPRPLRILVEHTSANPVHPLHIGHLRNSIVGDALARILRARGHEVRVHFYLDDVGLQVAYAAYGHEKVKHLKRDMKLDHYIGLIYAITNAVIAIRELEEERRTATPEKRARIDSKLADWLWVAKELMERDEALFSAVAEAVKSERATERVREIVQAYEAGEEWAVELVRGVVNLCVKGFEQTLQRLDISFDSWDWESEITTWSGLAVEVVEQLRAAGYAVIRQGAVIFEADKLAADSEVRRRLRIPEGFHVTLLTLGRSDGTTLYATRDIAYAIWKFQQGVDKVINVIGAQQTLEQIHVRLALCALGYAREAENTVHFSYEMVTLPGVKMSGRRGRFVSADEMVEEAVRRAREELEKRGLKGAEEAEIAERVGVGAVKFAMLSASPSRPLTFSWDRVLDFDRNSGPFVQYAYVRARSVLQKAGDLKPEVARETLGEEERRLLFLVGYSPEAVAKAADELKVELIPQYLNELALEFNSYYDKVPILKAEPREKAFARLALVKMVATALENGMRLIGIEPPRRM